MASWKVEDAGTFCCVYQDGVLEEVPHLQVPVVAVDPEKRGLF